MAFYDVSHVARAAVADLDAASIENFVKRVACVEILVDKLKEDFADIC